MSNDNAIEQEIQSKNLTATRITPADLEAAISSEWFFTADEAVDAIGAKNNRNYDGFSIRHDDNQAQVSLSLLTICVLVLTNGFTIIGKSACASRDNFDAELGRKLARQDAVSQMWPLLGYALKERLQNETKVEVMHFGPSDDGGHEMSLRFRE